MIILSNDKNVFYLDLRFFDKIKERSINSMNNIIRLTKTTLIKTTSLEEDNFLYKSRFTHYKKFIFT